MNLNIARSLYETKYRFLYSFELYLHLIINGLSLLKSRALNQHCSIIDHKAMKLALEYNLKRLRSGISGSLAKFYMHRNRLCV